MTRAERWVSLDMRRSLRLRVVDRPDHAPSVEFAVLTRGAEDAGEPLVALPVGAVRALARTLASLAGELGLTP